MGNCDRRGEPKKKTSGRRFLVGRPRHKFFLYFRPAGINPAPSPSPPHHPHINAPMLGADADPTVSFFCLLKADRGGVVEAACARLAALPASLAKAPPALTFDALDAALATLTTAAGISAAGLPPDTARQARLAAHGYRCEARSLASAGRDAASLLFLGRALEVSRPEGGKGGKRPAARPPSAHARPGRTGLAPPPPPRRRPHPAPPPARRGGGDAGT